MKVLPLHDIPPVRKPKTTVLPADPAFPILPYACPRPIKPRSRRLSLLEIGMILCMILIAGAVILPRLESHDVWVPDGRVEGDLSALEGALDQFQRDTGRLPTSAEGLNVLLMAPANVSNWRGPYIMHPAKDPWGSAYLYRRLPSGKFEVRCVGRDGKPNTADDIIRNCTPVQ